MEASKWMEKDSEVEGLFYIVLPNYGIFKFDSTQVKFRQVVEGLTLSKISTPVDMRIILLVVESINSGISATRVMDISEDLNCSKIFENEHCRIFEIPVCSKFDIYYSKVIFLESKKHGFATFFEILKKHQDYFKTDSVQLKIKSISGTKDKVILRCAHYFNETLTDELALTINVDNKGFHVDTLGMGLLHPKLLNVLSRH